MRYACGSSILEKERERKREGGRAGTESAAKEAEEEEKNKEKEKEEEKEEEEEEEKVEVEEEEEEEEEEKKKKGPDSVSKRLDREPKRNKLLHELVAVIPSSSRSSASFSKDGCHHPAVSRRVCGPPSRHKDSYLTRGGLPLSPSSLSPAAPSNGTPKPGAGRDPDNTCPSGRQRR